MKRPRDKSLRDLETTGIDPDIWSPLAALTPARIALGRTGASLPTREVLRFALAHAQARDAVHIPLDRAALNAALRPLGLPIIEVASAAATRESYLRRPDLGRKLGAEGRSALAGVQGEFDLAIMIGDGLSSTAVEKNAAPLIAALLQQNAAKSFSLAPLVLAEQARVALGDEIGAILRARAILVLIGERPGLSASDSLGAYLTYAPRLGRRDSERNCVSNIRQGGLKPDLAAARLLWLLRESFRLGLSGISLKDESGAERYLS
jgi:ethanolamine ammonia-lyase small subunit